jgi:site-specific recombinase XerD
VTKLSPHVLRHACASRLYGDGIGIVAIQQLLGHRWLSTTIRYVHVSEDSIETEYRRAAERGSARFKEV